MFFKISRSWSNVFKSGAAGAKRLRSTESERKPIEERKIETFLSRSVELAAGALMF